MVTHGDKWTLVLQFFHLPKGPSARKTWQNACTPKSCPCGAWTADVQKVGTRTEANCIPSTDHATRETSGLCKLGPYFSMRLPHISSIFIIFPNDSKHFQTQVGETGLCFHATFEVVARELAGAGCCECCYGRLVARCHECI